MTAARERLMDTSEKLRLAFVSLRTVDEEVTARLTGVGTLPLSEASTRVSQAAGMAKTVALTVLKAAGAAKEVATTAATAVSAAQEAKATAAAKSEAAKAAVEAAEAANAATEATKATATVALKSEIDAPTVRDRRRPSGDDDDSRGSSSMSSTGMEFETANTTVAVKTGESDISDSEEQQSVSPRDTEARGEENESSHDRHVVSEVGNADKEKQEEAEGTPRIDGGEEKEEEEEHGEREEQEADDEDDEEYEETVDSFRSYARRVKRKLGGAAKAPRRYSVRKAGSRRRNYAERDSGSECEDAMLSSVSDDVEDGDIPVAVEATRGKRKLGDTGKPCRHQNLRAAGSRQPQLRRTPHTRAAQATTEDLRAGNRRAKRGQCGGGSTGNFNAYDRQTSWTEVALQGARLHQAAIFRQGRQQQGGVLLSARDTRDGQCKIQQAPRIRIIA